MLDPLVFFFSPEILRIVNIFERLQAFIGGQAGILRAGSIVFSQGLYGTS